MSRLQIQVTRTFIYDNFSTSYFIEMVGKAQRKQRKVAPPPTDCSTDEVKRRKGLDRSVCCRGGRYYRALWNVCVRACVCVCVCVFADIHSLVVMD